MKNQFKFLLLLFLLFSFKSYGQFSCGFETISNKKMKAPDYALKEQMNEAKIQDNFINNVLENSNENQEEIITIPVVFHVLYRESFENIENDMILAELEKLNNDFSGNSVNIPDDIPIDFNVEIADVNIRFELASIDPEGLPTNGIVRKQINSNFRITDDFPNSDHYQNSWDVESYLNIYIVPSFTGGDNTEGGGFSSNIINGDDLNEPWDGVVITLPSLGKTILTHEIGHYLALPHIYGFRTTDCPGDEDYEDDNIEDTPPQSGPLSTDIRDFPFPYDDDKGSCYVRDVVERPLAMLFMNSKNNRFMFTEGQKSVMRSTVLNKRSGFIPKLPKLSLSKSNPILKDNEILQSTDGKIRLSIEEGVLSLQSRNVLGSWASKWNINTKAGFWNAGKDFSSYRLRLTEAWQLEFVGGSSDQQGYFVGESVLWSSDFIGHPGIKDANIIAKINDNGQLIIQDVDNGALYWTSSVMEASGVESSDVVPRRDLSSETQNYLLHQDHSMVDFRNKNKSSLVNEGSGIVCVAYLSGNNLVIDRLKANALLPGQERSRVWTSPVNWIRTNIPDDGIPYIMNIGQYNSNKNVFFNYWKLFPTNYIWERKELNFGPFDGASQSALGYRLPKLVLEKTGSSTGCGLIFSAINNVTGVRENLWESDRISQAPPRDITTLYKGQELLVGQYLKSRNGMFKAEMQADGNFVLSHLLKGCNKWDTKTNNTNANRFVFQNDGNIVVYQDGSSKWSPNINGQGGDKLIMQDDGNLVMYDANGKAVWATGTPEPILNEEDDINAKETLGPTEQLIKGQYLISTNKKYKLYFQDDGNLVIYGSSNGCGVKILWASGTENTDVSRLRMQEDGNWVLIGPSGVKWETNTRNSGSPSLILGDDGSLVLVQTNFSTPKDENPSTDPMSTIPNLTTIPPLSIDDLIPPLLVPPVDNELFDTTNSISTSGPRVPLWQSGYPYVGMVSTDGKCKASLDRTHGFAMYHYTDKVNPVFKTGRVGFNTEDIINLNVVNNPLMFNLNGLVVRNEVINKVVWQGNSVYQTTAPHTLYIKSVEQANNIEKNGDDDGCILISKKDSNNNDIAWTDEMGGRVINVNPENIFSLMKEQVVMAYPNPVKGTLFVSSKEKMGVVTVNDTKGLLIATIKNFTEEGKHTEINVRSYKEAIYILNIYRPDGSIIETKKIYIE